MPRERSTVSIRDGLVQNERMASDDRETFKEDEGGRGSRPGALRPLIRLTILWHPDVDRVGEVSILDGGRVEVSRHGQMFAPIDGGVRRTLETFMVSRTPIVFEVGPATVSVTDKGHSKVYIDGKRVTQWPVYFSRRQLAAGMVLIEINRRVLLGLDAAHPVPAARSRHEMVGDSVAIRRLRLAVDEVAAAAGPVLVQGETGSGKELVAHGIHRASARWEQRFIPLNCGQLRAERIASTLFGHRRGAFTGAAVDHLGAFREAHGGTLFLDEIGELPDEAQPALLRALDKGEIMPLGAKGPVVVSTRVIAATDADLLARTERGTFRKALYYRLHALVVDVPPLRARPDDIPRILLYRLRRSLGARGAAQRLSAGNESGWPWLDARIVSTLVRRPWRGNVRELLHFADSLAMRGAGVEQVDEQLIAELDQRPTATSQARSTHGSTASHSTSSQASGPLPQPVVTISSDPLARALASRSDTGPLPPSPQAPGAGLHVFEDPVVMAGSDGRGYTRAGLLELLREHGWSIHRTARLAGLPKTSLSRYAEQVLKIAPVAKLDKPTLEARLAAAGGDVERLAAEMRVTPRALTQRLRALGIGYDEPAR